ncbi:CopG family transcriptional regulator [Sphaerisporangium sp. NPDC051011]|uniref:ribbon-helix-helix domain-containing protein n=1 Tax=Sphaerisporangium sp. NPDC051011 TaxID=3155792 RepID=UPI00340D8190
MKRTTIKLSDDLAARVLHESERRGMTMSEWTREAIEAHLPGNSQRRLLAAGAGHSGEGGISERIHEILDRE